MLHPDIPYDIAARHWKARLAQAATIAQAGAAPRSPRQPWKAGLRAVVQGPAIAAAADGLTCTQEPAYARGVRVDHRVTLIAALFRDVKHPGGES